MTRSEFCGTERESKRWGTGASDPLNFVRTGSKQGDRIYRCPGVIVGGELEGRETSAPHRDMRSRTRAWRLVELYAKGETYSSETEEMRMSDLEAENKTTAEIGDTEDWKVFADYSSITTMLNKVRKKSLRGAEENRMMKDWPK